ncbi:hypothetical protein [Citrobacter phage vB_CfrS_K1M]
MIQSIYTNSIDYDAYLRQDDFNEGDVNAKTAPQ